MQAYDLRMQAAAAAAAVVESDTAEEVVEPSPSELPPPRDRQALTTAAAPSTSGQQQQQQQQQHGQAQQPRAHGGAGHAPGMAAAAGAAAAATTAAAPVPAPPNATPVTASVSPAAAASARPLAEPAETPIANLAVRLFHDPPTAGRQLGAARSSSATGLPPKHSPQLQLQCHSQPPQQPQPAPQQQREHVHPLQQQQQQQRHQAAPAARPAPQLLLTRPAAAPRTWDAQSQAHGPDGGWAETQPNLGPNWARLESQCGATWSPPCPPTASGGAARRRSDGTQPDGGGDPEGVRHRLGQQQQQDDSQQQHLAAYSDSHHPYHHQQHHDPAEAGAPRPTPPDGGTQPPSGWEGETQPGPLGGATEDDADVVPPTPVKTGDGGEVGAPATAATAAAGVAARSAGTDRRRPLDQRACPQPPAGGGTAGASQQQRKRRLPALAGAGDREARSPDEGGAAPVPAPVPAPHTGSGSGRSAAKRAPGSAPERRRSASGGGSFWHAWQPQGLPAAGPSAHVTVCVAAAVGAAQPSAAAQDEQQQQPQQQAQLRLELGSAVQRLIPVCDGECGVLLAAASAAAAAASGSKGSRRRSSFPSGAAAASSAYSLLVISMALQEKQQQQERQRRAGVAAATLQARGMWRLEVRGRGVDGEAVAMHGMQLLPGPAHPRGSRSQSTLLAAVPEVTVCGPAEADGKQHQSQQQQPADVGVNVWQLSSGGGGAASQLRQALPTDDRMCCVAAAGGAWLAAAGVGGRAYVWPMAPRPEQQRFEQQQRQQQQPRSGGGGWIRQGQARDDEFFDAPTLQNQRDSGARAASSLAAAPVDAAGRVALPPATLRGMPFPEVSELCFVPEASDQQQDFQQQATGAAAGQGWLLAGCSSAGAVALWDVGRQQLLVAAFPSLGGLSRLLPLPQADARQAPAQPLPLVLLARVPAEADGSCGEAGPGKQQLAHVVMHGGGAAVSAPLPLHMPVAAAAVCGPVGAAVSDDGRLVAWDLLQGSCLLRGALPLPRPGAGAKPPASAAAAESARACVGFLSQGVLLVGTPEGALHAVLL
jgi:hypothetical protein